MQRKNVIENIGIRYGLLSAAGFIAFFLLMRAVGLAQVLELRAFNFFILVTGIAFAIQKLRREENGSVPYLEGLVCGALTVLVSVVVFSVFIFAYLQFISPEFMAYIQQHGMFGRFLNPVMAAVSIFIEGTFSGLIVSFGIMQYMKRCEWDEMEEAETKPVKRSRLADAVKS
jgi:hypothetical protein